MKKLSLLYILIACCTACTLKEQHQLNNKSYFDLATYFNKEAARLSQRKTPITKTVKINGQTETKQLNISNWEKEFDSFISADINKVSWQGAFKTEKSAQTTSYISNSDKIPVKKVEVTYSQTKVRGIRIFVTHTNDLYTSTDTLSYYPDSLYEIKKIQHIKLMNEKKYQIIGKFK